ncbi:MAG: hypothetical protein ACOX04_05865 [Candidatus Scatomorpha sp.]
MVRIQPYKRVVDNSRLLELLNGFYCDALESTIFRFPYKACEYPLGKQRLQHIEIAVVYGIPVVHTIRYFVAFGLSLVPIDKTGAQHLLLSDADTLGFGVGQYNLKPVRKTP